MAWWGRSKPARPRTPSESKLSLEALEDRLNPSASPLMFALSPRVDSQTLAATTATSSTTPPAIPWGTAIDLGNGFADVEMSAAQNGRTDHLALRTNGTLVFRSQNQPSASWSSWSVLGNNFRAATLARHANGRLEIFAIGRDGSLNTRLQNQPGGDWGSWNKTTAAYADVKAFSRTDGRIELFLLGSTAASLREHRIHPTALGETSPGMPAHSKKFASRSIKMDEGKYSLSPPAGSFNRKPSDPHRALGRTGRPSAPASLISTSSETDRAGWKSLP